MQGDTTEQVHKGGQVNVSNQGGNPVPKDSVAERTKQPLTDFSELGLDMMQDMQEEIKAMEKQLKDKKAALAMAEAKGPEEQDDLSSVSSTDVVVGGQASTFIDNAPCRSMLNVCHFPVQVRQCEEHFHANTTRFDFRLCGGVARRGLSPYLA